MQNFQYISLPNKSRMPLPLGRGILDLFFGLVLSGTIASSLFDFEIPVNGAIVALWTRNA